MSEPRSAPFYVGYLPTPPGLRTFLLAVSTFLLGGFAALALAIGTAQDDPGRGDFQWGWGVQTVTGRLEVRPYPILHVTTGTERVPAGRTLLLSGVGKKGVQSRVESLDGRVVRLKGIALKRGDIDALQVGDGKDDISAVADTGTEVAPAKALGRWRLIGEICDGKCLAGAMRPGTGLSHRACANLCLIGGAPPVFVSAAPVDGSTFLLMGDKDGNPLPARILDHVALFVSLEGTVERRGRILVLKVDLNSLKVL
ncbi:MAG: hypothetical protein AAGC70_02640 [Pseudomonadota bacterium]